MPQYIDIDTAIRTAIEMCIKVVGHGITQIDAVNIANAFENIPTADVVPKSEVEKFAEDIKLEFYREFDEIIPSIMADKIDELKKKYTEGVNERSRS